MKILWDSNIDKAHLQKLNTEKDEKIKKYGAKIKEIAEYVNNLRKPILKIKEDNDTYKQKISDDYIKEINNLKNIANLQIDNIMNEKNDIKIKHEKLKSSYEL